jgi:hypothetical protein
MTTRAPTEVSSPRQERSGGAAVGAHGIQTLTHGLEYRDGARCHRSAALCGLGSKLRPGAHQSVQPGCAGFTTTVQPAEWLVQADFDSWQGMNREQKITLGEMRSGNGPTRLTVYCSDLMLPVGRRGRRPWGDDVRLSDLEPKFTCKSYGRRGADVRPIFEKAAMGTEGGVRINGERGPPCPGRRTLSTN